MKSTKFHKSERHCHEWRSPEHEHQHAGAMLHFRDGELLVEWWAASYRGLPDDAAFTVRSRELGEVRVGSIAEADAVIEEVVLPALRRVHAQVERAFEAGQPTELPPEYR